MCTSDGPQPLASFPQRGLESRFLLSQFSSFFIYVWFSFRSARQGSKSSHLSVRYDRIDAALGFDSFPPSHVLVFYVFLLVTLDSAYSDDDVCSHTPVKATRVFPYTERGRGDYTRCRPDFLPLSSRIDLGHPKFLFGVGSLCVRCSLFLFLSLLLLWFMSGGKRGGGGGSLDLTGSVPRSRYAGWEA